MHCDLSSLKPGDRFPFGSYVPAALEGREPLPIFWRVLDRQENGEILILSEEILDCLPFHSGPEISCWKESDLLDWLNGWFFHTAFTREEKTYICQSGNTGNTPGDLLWELTHPDGDTFRLAHRVFLLSLSDVDHYFEGKELRRETFHPALGIPDVRIYDELRAGGTPYVQELYGDGLNWWLRTFFQISPAALVVRPSGAISASITTGEKRAGVRPALWLRTK